MGTARVRRAAVLAGALAAALVGPSACAPSPATSRQAEATVVGSAADCLAPEVLDELGLTLDPSLAARASHAPAPTPGRVPDDFDATRVVVCQVGGQMRDSAGTWTAVTATSREGADGDVAALVAALAAAASAAPGAPAGTDPCDSEAARLVLWLVDAIDRTVLPVVPVDACGGPTQAVLDALDSLAVTAVADHPVELVVPAS